MKTYTVLFTPQQWRGDYAIVADPPGIQFWSISEREARDILGGIEPKESAPDTYETDALRFSSNAPKLAQEWDGPFYCEIVA